MMMLLSLAPLLLPWLPLVVPSSSSSPSPSLYNKLNKLARRWGAIKGQVPLIIARASYYMSNAPNNVRGPKDDPMDVSGLGLSSSLVRRTKSYAFIVIAARAAARIGAETDKTVRRPAGCGRRRNKNESEFR